MQMNLLRKVSLLEFRAASSSDAVKPFVVISGGLFVAWAAIAAPRLAVPPEGIAFGEVFVGSNAVGRIELRNAGNATVSVSRVKACCGAKAELSSPKIPPNGCECCQCENVASSNVASFQLGIGNWNWILATSLRTAPRHPPRPAPSRSLPLAHAARTWSRNMI